MSLSLSPLGIRHSAFSTLEELARRIQEIESSRQPLERSANSLDIAALDDCLPGGRLPAGSLVELLASAEGAGAWTLALIMARQVCGERKALIICDDQGCFYPPAVSKWGLDLARLIVLRPANFREGDVAVGQSLRCPAVGAVISWHTRLRTLDFRRLSAAAEAGGGVGFLLRPSEARRDPSFAALRLLVTPMATLARRIQVDVLRCRGGKCRSLVLEIDDETGHVRVPSRLAASAPARERPELRDRPIAVSDSNAPRGPRVILCSRRAARWGVRPGMPVAEAVSIECALYVQEKEPEKDAQALGRLAEWLTRYSPIVGLEENLSPQSLLLDVSGCAACFHGEKNLLRRAARELASERWIARVALADTVGAAWALAHFADTSYSALSPKGGKGSSFLAPPGEPVLLPLPVAALRLPPETVCALEKLGIEKVSQLTALARASIPARFGEEVLRRLDQALGRVPEVFAPYRPPPVVDANCPFDYPSDHPEHLHYALDQLTKRIAAALRRHHLGARRIECWLYSEETEPFRMEIALCQPSDSARHIAALLRTRLEQSLLAKSVCGMSLRVIAAEPIPDLQSEFFETNRPCVSQDLSVLIDRLSSRLGPEAVTRAILIPDPQPEFACRFQHSDEWRVTSDEQQPSTHSALVTRHSAFLSTRPVRLWPAPVRIEVVSTVPEGPPIRFWWRGVEYRVVCSRGPERIETGWWRGQDVQRDYYTVATQKGSRFWIFRRREDSRWFLHGCFD